MPIKPTPLKDGSYPGEIRVFAGEIPPDGWLECDGQEYPDTKYPKLSAVIGDLWGSTLPNHFRVPDLRGLFLRGWNHGKQDSVNDPADPDAGNRNLRPGAPGGSKDHVGSWQGDELLSHQHSTNRKARWGDKFADDIGFSADNGEHPHGPFNIDTTPYGGHETRPRNAYVMFCIRHGGEG
jgi:hypothetical protein